MKFELKLKSAALTAVVAAGAVLVADAAIAEGLYGEAGPVYLTRDSEDDYILSVVPNNPDTILSSSDRVLMTSEDMDVDWDVGGTFTLGYAWDDKNAVEGTYTYFQQDGDASITSTSMVLEPSFYFGTHFGIEDFRDAYRHDVSYDSDLHDFQLNYRRNYGGNFTSIVGFRYIQLDEEFEFIGTDTSAPGSAKGRYTNDTENRLLGLQAGGEYVWPLANNGWSIGVKAVGGAFYNDGSIKSSISSPTPPVIPGRPTVAGAFDSGTSSFSGSVDGNVSVNWEVTDAVSLSAGYQALFLSGLALVSENYMEVENDGPTFFSTKASGSTLFHGAFLKARLDF